MIEMKYKGNTEEKGNNGSHITPKNVRQIGEIGRDRKVYLEDYAVTYIHQVSAAMLLGEFDTNGKEQHIYINGAIEVGSGEKGDIDWENVYREVREHFGDQEIIGYYREMDDEPLEITEEIGELFRSCFSDENRVLILRDAAENEDAVFLMENGLLRKQTGYYIYYEKNQAMQEYMVAKNEGRSNEQETAVPDKAIKDFRKIIKEKKAKKEEAQQENEPEQRQKNQTIKKIAQTTESTPAAKTKTPRYLYAASTFLVLVIAVIGVTIMNNNDKMDRVESTLANLTQQVDSQSNQTNQADDQANSTEEQEVNATVTEAATEGTSDAAAANETQAADQSNEQQTEAAETEANAATEQTNDDTQNTEQTTQESQTSQTETSAADAAASVQSSYTVKAGDTLASICRMYYGNTDNLEKICEINNISDPNTIILGQKILLP